MSLCKWRVKLSEVHALALAVNCFPKETPRRWSLVSKLMGKADSLGSTTLEVGLPSAPGRKTICCEFDGSEIHCKELCGVLEIAEPGLFHQQQKVEEALFSDGTKTSFKPLILLPGRMKCCGKKVSIRNRPSFPLVFTTHGTLVAAAYSGTCTSCRATIHHSSWVPAVDGNVEHFFEPHQSTYFLGTSQTGFEVQFLKQLTNQMVHAGVTFESQALVYNDSFGTSDEKRLASMTEVFSRTSACDWKLNEKRLEDGWFLYSIVEYYSTQEDVTLENVNLATMANKGNRRDFELLCEQVNEHRLQSSPKWVAHECHMKGCSEGFAVVDGNEKINRPICAAPRCKIVLPEQFICMTTLCSRSPMTGGKSATPSKYCSLHHQLDDTTTTDASLAASSRAAMPHPHTPDPMLQKDKVGLMPASDDNSLLVGCRKQKGVTKFYDRTAGVLALVRPCGIFVNTCEMYTCESPTQVYLFLIMTFAREQDITRLKYLGYDRSCDLHPFLKNLESKGAYFAKWLNSKVTFFVDSFHVAKHTEPCCMPPQNPDCKYHPSLPHLREIHGVNTECAEQSFRWLNKLKLSMKQMHQHKFNFFLHTITNHRNLYTEQQLRQKKYL